MMKIFTFSVVYSAAEEFADKTPYAVAIISRQDGSRFMGYIDGPIDISNLEIGMDIIQTEDFLNGVPLYKPMKWIR